MSIFTKKHYEWLAKHAANHLVNWRPITDLMTALKDENPKFDLEKFRKAVVSEQSKSEEEPTP